MSIHGHSLFGNITFELSNDCQNGRNYKTVIIGPNGTGKSTILSCVADALTIECSDRKNKSLATINYGYDLEAQAGEKSALISSSELIKDKNFGKGKILAVSSTPNDRFPFLAKNSVRKTSQYAYLGLKSASNNIFFSNMKEKLFKDMLVICRSARRLRSALAILRELGFNSKFSIELAKGSNYAEFARKLSRKRGAGDEDTVKEFQNAAFTEFSSSVFYRENKASIQDLIAELDESQEVRANLATISRNKRLSDKLALIARMLEAKILTISAFSIFSESNVDLHQSSSGEFNILRIFLSIIAHVENESVVIIDEPEVSLHPNWQISFLSLLDIALAEFSGCHSLIATHSHFILSNLDGANSSILALSFDRGSQDIRVESLDVNSYGWSPEHTLYQVFGVTGFRNKYLEMDLRILINYLSNGTGSFQRFKSAYGRVRKFNITEDDPLWRLLQNAGKKVEAMR